MARTNVLKTLYAKLAGTQAILFIVIGIALVLGTERIVAGEHVVELATDLVIGAVLFSLIGRLLIFHVLTRRLRALTEAVDRFRGADLQSIRLASVQPDGDESTSSARQSRRCRKNLATDRGTTSLTKFGAASSLANVSHDLRTPLASMQGYLETLLLRQTPCRPRRSRATYEIAAKHSERLGKLIRDLFQLTKLRHTR